MPDKSPPAEPDGVVESVPGAQALPFHFNTWPEVALNPSTRFMSAPQPEFVLLPVTLPYHLPLVPSAMSPGRPVIMLFGSAAVINTRALSVLVDSSYTGSVLAFSLYILKKALPFGYAPETVFPNVNFVNDDEYGIVPE